MGKYTFKKPDAAQQAEEAERAEFCQKVVDTVRAPAKPRATMADIDAAAKVSRRDIPPAKVVEPVKEVEPIDPGDSNFFLQLDDAWVIRGDGSCYTLCEIRTITGEGRGAARAKEMGTIGQKREVIVGYHGNLRCAAVQYVAKAPGAAASQVLPQILARLDAIDITLNKCFPVK